MSKSFYCKPMVKLRAVRKYMGHVIPTRPHDCTETESCSICRAIKREFIASKPFEETVQGVQR